MREMFRMVVVLSLICGLSGMTLAGLRQATRVRIEEQVLTYVQEPVLLEVLGDHDNDPVKDRRSFGLDDGEVLTVFPVREDGRLTGVAFETFGQGYGGDIGVITVFDLGSDSILAICMTTMKETPGVGDRVAGLDFTGQYSRHALANVALTSQGGDINAVAGATISSTGAATAVGKAVKLYRRLKPQFLDAWS